MPTPVSTPPIIRLGLSMSSFLLLLVAVPSFPHVHAENKKPLKDTSVWFHGWAPMGCVSNL